MAQQIKVDIMVKNQKISPFSSLSIHQQFNEHHYFELRFNHDVIEDKEAVLIKNSMDYLGEQITITFGTDYITSLHDNVFKGIITDISITNNEVSHGDILFRGYSPTILMQGGENNSSHIEKNLSQIVQNVNTGIPGNVLVSEISPENAEAIPYMVQYRESDFDFVRRIAAEYGEWFFYNGTKFYFGKPQNLQEIHLEYPRDITDISLQMKVAPLNFEHKDYYSKEDTKLSGASSLQNVSGLDTFGKHALKTSDKLYNTPVTALSSRPSHNGQELDKSIKVQKSALASRMVYLHASCDSPYVKLGNIISVSAESSYGAKEDFGKYIVTSVIHSLDGLGNYSNIFEGIPSSLHIVPNAYNNKPLAEPQLGIVVNLADPDNLGKVKVQLLWQKEGESTPYISVMYPHAGMRNDDKKNRGAFFTPEVGDYVIVGFTQNDPDRPFVMGSVPHGKAINTSMNNNNDVKAIRTRSGNTIYFYDKEDSKEQEIRIETNNDNYVSILMQDNKGNIKIYSTDTIDVKSDKVVNVTSKDITIKASNNVNIQASKDIILEASGNISMKATSKAELNGQEINVQGSQAVSIKGLKVDIEATTSASLKASTQLELQSSAMASLKGAMVQIN